MNFVFFGGHKSRFAEIILEELIKAGLKPVETIRDAKKTIDVEYLKSLNADFFIVASFAKILKKEVIEIPQKRIIGVHPSLLPKYRGPSPIQSVILNDEKETGTTLFLIDEKVDHGPMLATSRLRLATSDNYKSLEEKLAKLSADLIIKELPRYISGEIKPQEQNHSEATFTKKFSTESAEIKMSPPSPEKHGLGASPEKFLNPANPKEAWLKIKAFNPEPGAYTILKLKNGKELRLKLLEADLTHKSDEADKSYRLDLRKVQPEGKKPMPYSAFLNGYQRLLA